MESPLSIAVIPARGGSKGVPRKALRVIHCEGGGTLLGRCIRTVQKSDVDFIYVSTEDAEIASLARLCGAEVIDRPAELASDTALTVDVLLHACQYVSAKYLVLVQCTSPFMVPQDINDALITIQRERADVCIVCYPTDAYQVFVDQDGQLQSSGFSFKTMSRRQDRWPMYDIVGSAWVLDYHSFTERRTIYGGKIVKSLAKHPRWEIDSEEELSFAKGLLEAGMSDIFRA